MASEYEKMAEVLDEHAELVERFKAGDPTALVELMETALDTTVGSVEVRLMA